VPAPTRDTEFSLRAAHQFGEKHSGYVQYSYQDWTGQNQGVGGPTLASAGYNSEYREDDLVGHVDSTLSAVTLNQLSLVANTPPAAIRTPSRPPASACLEIFSAAPLSPTHSERNTTPAYRI